MKKCKKCGIDKDESEFFKKREKWLQGTCKECKKKRVQELIGLDPESHREKERLRSEKRRQTQEWKEWRKDHQKRNRTSINKKAIETYHEKKSLDTQRIWKEKNKKKLRKYQKDHREKFPFKLVARRYVRTAITQGILVRPDKCSGCLKECKAEAHHEDYTKPLEVIWLCRSCHGKVHRKRKDKI